MEEFVRRWIIPSDVHARERLCWRRQFVPGKPPMRRLMVGYVLRKTMKPVPPWTTPGAANKVREIGSASFCLSKPPDGWRIHSAEKPRVLNDFDLYDDVVAARSVGPGSGAASGELDLYA